MFWAAIEGGIGGLIGGKIPTPKFLDKIDKLINTVDNMSLALDFVTDPKGTLKAMAEGQVMGILENKI